MKKLLSIMLSISLAVSGSAFVIPVSAANRNITVGKSHMAEFTPIQEALDSITFTPSESSNVIINIEPGTYFEPITVDIPYVTFNNTDKTGEEPVIIAYDNASVHESDPAKSLGTQGSATVTVTEKAHDFTANNITFENTYNLDQPNLGSDGGRAQNQAVAVVTLGDRISFYGCSFLGRQDTLYLKGASAGQDVYGHANNARVYLKDCFIEGTVDYIFGDATAVFENCDLNMAYYSGGGHYTAANTTLFNIGYVFIDCILTADKGLDGVTSDVDLGRPWQADSTYPNYGSHTAFINCSMDDRIESYGFSLWNEATVENKIRYYEYGTKNLDGSDMNMGDRAGYVKILTDEQASAYTAQNILSGLDGWNPEGAEGEADFSVADITLNSCNIEIPLYDTYELKPFVLPVEAENKSVVFTSSDNSIATVDSKGIIKAVGKGACTVTAVTSENGFSSTANIRVTDAKTKAPVIDSISISKTKDILPGDTLMAKYSFALPSDNDIDDSLIRWYSGDKAVKQGKKDYAGYYIVDEDDVGKEIRLEVVPSTTTSYGLKGEAVSTATEAVKQPAYETAPVYINEGFESLEAIPFSSETKSLSSDFAIFTGEDYSALGVNTLNDVRILSDEKIPGQFSLSARMRFNPETTGFTSTDVYDIITNYDKETNSYYRFNISRGSNTSSVKMYAYECINGEETLLGSNEESCANKVHQNSGSGNEWFTVNIVVSPTRVKYTLTLQGDTSALAKIITDRESTLGSGYLGIRSYGKVGVLLMDDLKVTGSRSGVKTYDENKIQIFLAGDSTVKTYGIEKSTGGWGEFLQDYFDSDKVEIVNKAEGGRSTRSFINQGRLDEILSEIGKGDYLFIQFGHNDCSDGEDYLEERYAPIGTPDENGIYPTTPGTKSETPEDLLALDTSYPYSSTYYSYDCGGTYKWYLKQYIEGARAKGAVPVLVTPITRMYFNDDNVIKPHHDDSTTNSNAYVSAMKQVGEEEGVVVLDLFGATEALYNKLGPIDAALLHDVKTDGMIDKTHQSKHGAFTTAGLLRELVDKSGLEIKKYTKDPENIVSSTEGLRKATAFILGDSTSCIYENDKNHSVPRGGWGMYIGNYMSDSLNIRDLAISGRSSKSFTVEDNYKTFLSDVRKGDYVFIQFGHNDRKNSTPEDAENRYTDGAGDKNTPGSFKYYLYNYYVKPTQEAGAIPILVTPVSERVFENGKTADTHGIYDDAVRELAAELDISLLDLTAISADLYNAVGESGTEKMFACYTDTEAGIDNVHFNHYGGDLIARYIAVNLLNDSSTIKNYVSPDKLNAEENIYATRGDFITDIMTLIGKTDVPADNFPDVDPGKAYANAAGNAKESGVTSGSDIYGNFNPEDYLLRQDMFTLTYNVLKAAGVELKTDKNPVEGFIDSAEISDYAKDPLNALIENEVIGGASGKALNPRKYAEKAETASVTNQLYKVLAAAVK